MVIGLVLIAIYHYGPVGATGMQVSCKLHEVLYHHTLDPKVVRVSEILLD